MTLDRERNTPEEMAKIHRKLDSTSPNTEDNADRELEDKLADIYSNAADRIAPKQPDGSIERKIVLGMVAETLIPIIALIKNRESSLLSRIEEAVPKEVKLNDMFGNDPRNNYGYSEELRVEGANYQARKTRRVIATIKAEIEGSTE